MTAIDPPSAQPLYHGTKVDLKQGDLIGPGTKSYRTRDPLRVVGEVTDWQGHSPERLKAMKDHLAHLRELGIEAIED